MSEGELEDILGDLRALPPSTKKARIVAWLTENTGATQPSQLRPAALVPAGQALQLNNQFSALAQSDLGEQAAEEEATRQRAADDAARALAIAAGTPVHQEA